MAPKVKLTNGFMTFVQEWRHVTPGGLAMSLPEAVSCCGEIWQVMSTGQRSQYVERANMVNVELRKQRNQRLIEMDLARTELEERLEKMKRATETMVMEGVKANDLENTVFFFVSFNFFTKTVSGDSYVPAEFSACKFSLKQGLISGYSTFINPGSIDLGQASDALHHSSTTHNLPLPPNALGEKDLTKLYGQIYDYLSSSSENKPVAVFTKREAMTKVRGTLIDLRTKSKHQGQEIWVHDLEYLLYVLKKQVLQIAGLPVDQITELATEAYLRKDMFEFAKHIACVYHENIDCSKYCSQSRIRRWVYSFCYILCEDLNIRKMPEKHMPRVENSEGDPEPVDDIKPDSKEVKKRSCLAGFGRGKIRGKQSTLGGGNI